MSTSAVVSRLVLALALLGPIDALDHDVQQAVQEGRRPGFESFMRSLSNTRQGAVVCGGLLLVAIATGPAGPATARVALAALVPVNLAVEGIKLAANRTRPDGTRTRSNSSFPSSHAANAAALALVLGMRWPRLSPVLALLAGLVAFSRVYLNRHFLSDVLMGAAIGVALSWLTVRWLRSRGWSWPARA
jgi:membrane-associated phospholipid phosphatase